MKAVGFWTDGRGTKKSYFKTTPWDLENWGHFSLYLPKQLLN